MSKYVVTGGAGFIGSHLALALAQRGDSIICLDNFDPYYDRKTKERNIGGYKSAGISLIELDLAVDNVEEFVGGVDAVFHLAAQPGISSLVPFEMYERNNILATQKLLDAISRLSRQPTFFFVSSSSVYGSLAIGDEETAPAPTSFYGVTKLAAEQLALAYWRDRGLPVSVARLFSVYGERERPEKLYPKLINSILKNEPFPLYEGSLEHRRSYTYVGDIISGLLAMLDAKDKTLGEIFNLGTDKTATTGEGIALVEELMGRKAMIKMLPPRAGDQKETSANIKKARELLDYSPSTTLRDGLAREVDWFTRSAGDPS